MQLHATLAMTSACTSNNTSPPGRVAIAPRRRRKQAAGSEIFWKSHDASHIREEEPEQLEDGSQAQPEEPAPSAPALPFIACFGLLAGLVLLTIFAGPMMDYTDATAAQLFDPNIYIDAVLKRAEQ